MSNLHPTMSQALDNFFDAIGAVQDAPMPDKAKDIPPPVKSPFVREWHSPGHGLPDLALDVFYYDADPGRRGSCGEPLEPYCPAGCEIQAVWLGQHDIMPLLSEDFLQTIEAGLMASDD